MANAFIDSEVSSSNAPAKGRAPIVSGTGRERTIGAFLTERPTRRRVRKS